MPTTHVLPESHELLQDIADGLGKAKKVLVVTGAGISTNSGIPDFRSKNGLYSLIQAQFEAAAVKDVKDDKDDKNVKDEAKPESHGSLKCDRGHPVKRRRIQDHTAASTIHVQLPCRSNEETIFCAANAATTSDSIVVQLPNIQPTTPARPPEDKPVEKESIECRLQPNPPSSSPLSSPPPNLFDMEEEFGAGVTTSVHPAHFSASSPTSSDSESETEEPLYSSQPTLSTQSSFSGRTGLPTMKGRELFDASIWADPLKTSVFYTFATSLRQKIKSVTPTPSHEFISHLRDTGKLVRCYTQNIDEIEEKVGLTTSLVLGPGKKGRFSTRSSRTSSANSTAVPKDKESQSQAPAEHAEIAKPAANQDPCSRGVECVFLHGSLRMLRCFRCGHTTPWDEDGRENETLSGRQPSCPKCEGATAAREGRGKRALAVGKLRPDIVLYGEEHPNAHLISPIVQHDIALAPDVMLILGTSLKVHGLKVLVREFSKAVHSRGGKVVFVNFTKPPESVWSDIIDYWIQWDCDAWVQDLKEKKPALWLPPGSVVEEPKKKRKSMSAHAKGHKGEEKKAAGKTKRAAKTASGSETQPDGSQPTSSQEDTDHGSFLMWKITDQLTDISESAADAHKPKPDRKPRHSAPAGLIEGELQIILENGIGDTYQLPSDKAPAAPRVEGPTGETSVHSPGESSGKPLEPLEPSEKAEVPRIRKTHHPVHYQAPEGYSIVSAVKANPQRRPSKRLLEAEETAALEKKVRGRHKAARQRAKSMGAMPTVVKEEKGQVPLGWSETDKLADKLLAQLTGPSRGGEEKAEKTEKAEEKAKARSTEPERPAKPEKPEKPAQPQPPDVTLPSIRQLFPGLPRATLDNAFFFQDPLCFQYGFPPRWPQDWSCNDQLQREADESSSLRRRGV